MHPWSSTIEIGAPADRVWELISQFEYWPDWGLSIRDVDPARGSVESGRTGRVQTAIGPWIPFEITTVREGAFWAWKVAGADATGHRVDPTSTGSRTTFTSPRWAPFYVPVLVFSLRRLRRLAESFDPHDQRH